MVINYFHDTKLGTGLETTSYKFGGNTIERTRILGNVECIYKEGVQVFDDADEKLNEFITNTQNVTIN